MAELVDAKDSQNGRVPLSGPRGFKSDKYRMQVRVLLSQLMQFDSARLSRFGKNKMVRFHPLNCWCNGYDSLKRREVAQLGEWLSQRSAKP